MDEDGQAGPSLVHPYQYSLGRPRAQTHLRPVLLTQTVVPSEKGESGCSRKTTGSHVSCRDGRACVLLLRRWGFRAGWWGSNIHRRGKISELRHNRWRRRRAWKAVLCVLPQPACAKPGWTPRYFKSFEWREIRSTVALDFVLSAWKEQDSSPRPKLDELHQPLLWILW